MSNLDRIPKMCICAKVLWEMMLRLLFCFRFEGFVNKGNDNKTTEELGQDEENCRSK